jgi:hypothetical protein
LLTCIPFSTYRFTSAQLSLFSDSWKWRLFWGLMDIAVTNTYALFRLRNPQLQHRQFYKAICVQLFDMAAPVVNQNVHTTRITSHVVSSSASRARCSSAPPTSRSSPTKTVCIRGRFAGSYKRSCYFCKITNNCSRGSVRADGRTTRMEYPKSHHGCTSCNVALCLKGPCWDSYHQSHKGQNDGVDPDRLKWEN